MCARCSSRAAKRVRTLVEPERSTSDRGYGWWYQQARVIVLAQQPYCAVCKRNRSEQVDHIVPLSQGGDAHDLTNLRGICLECHAPKSAREGSVKHGRARRGGPQRDENHDEGARAPPRRAGVGSA